MFYDSGYYYFKVHHSLYLHNFASYAMQKYLPFVLEHYPNALCAC